jgi:hypothetical protein
MSRPGTALGAVAVSLIAFVANPAYADEPPVRVEQDRTTVSTVIGDRFSFTSTISSIGDRPARNLVAHLNIVSLDPAVYVDPEDWSGERSRYIDEIPAGGSKELAWTVQAVNDGTFLVYVALATPNAGGPVVAGPALKAEVAAQRVINAGGILPIAVAVPGVLLVATLAARVRSRRRS